MKDENVGVLRNDRDSGTCRGASSSTSDPCRPSGRQIGFRRVTPGRPVKREGIRRRSASCWPAFIGCARRTGISKHPIVLSVFRSRVRPIFFSRGICQDAAPRFLPNDEKLRGIIWIAKISRFSLTAESNGRIVLRIGTLTSPPAKWRRLELKWRFSRWFRVQISNWYSSILVAHLTRRHGHPTMRNSDFSIDVNVEGKLNV